MYGWFLFGLVLFWLAAWLVGSAVRCNIYDGRELRLGWSGRDRDGKAGGEEICRLYSGVTDRIAGRC